MNATIWTLLLSKREQTTTQNEMARALGISQAAVAKLEARDFARIRVGDLYNYANALGLSIQIRIS